ncbi:LCP family protein [Streptacidiphilus sp. PB12-B1b]|uniref:LCP family protein n=1 Tax=Streptacidiphilus sp. PB12-B1b TaxID=2705012 RepID=UPI0015FC65C1|nr:LCP family protein [Streptacidiphilus sp. PB12-B1b]QMU79678.1 LCP family protein [Streptacidiphilus sp. PB12-B1b]
MSGTKAPSGRAAARRGGTPPDASGLVGRAAARKNRQGKRKKTVKIVCISLAGVVVLAAAGVGYEYNKLNGNITADNLFNGSKKPALTEKPDAFGRTPLNILVLGSDTRSSAADCKIGGDCSDGGVGANADVEMVVHLSADRSNATVMSIPRDLETTLPACTDTKDHTSFGGGVGMINSSLQYGPGCTVAAVEQLTGIPIDHFAMVDFSGVVNMSDAIGGVSVCVSANVYDPDSHLKLSKGTHTLQGLGALEFLRTRHGFGDGSDLGRTYAQHIFLTQMINKLKSADTLSNPVKLLDLAGAATKALTVDTGLDSIPKLVDLADDLNKVPTDRITFTTMQNQPDPANNNRVVIGPGAQTLFRTIANDQSLTTAGGGKSTAATATATATAAPAPTVPAAQIAVQVLNGTGLGGRAGTVESALVNQGYSSNSSVGDAPSAATTSLSYPAAEAGEAKEVAASLGLPGSALKQGGGSQLTLVIGRDWTSGSTFPGGKASPAAADTKVALSGAHDQTGNQTNSCAPVSTQYTVALNGVGMTPTQAYNDSPKVPDSAP